MGDAEDISNRKSNSNNDSNSNSNSNSINADQADFADQADTTHLMWRAGVWIASDICNAVNAENEVHRTGAVAFLSIF